MIQFVSEEVRTQFHLLSPERQKQWEEMASSFYSRGFVIKIYYIEEVFPGCLEASIRINKEFDPELPVDSDQLNLPGIE